MYNVKTAAVFSDDMVLQRYKNVRIWRDGNDGTLITAEINGKSACSAGLLNTRDIVSYTIRSDLFALADTSTDSTDP